MYDHFESFPVADDARWLNFSEDLIAAATAPDSSAEHFRNALVLFRRLGVQHAIVEHFYIDRDFSASNSSFYSTLFQPFSKLCKRIHFFGAAFDDDFMQKPVDERSDYLSERDADYLGHIVLRPIKKAPVSSVVASSDRCASLLDAEITISGTAYSHLMGAKLSIHGTPATEQDSRVGACAQAALWTVGRHFHLKHKGAWYSVPKITELALLQSDRSLAWDLPAGSTSLSLDAMIRALRAMDRHPLLVAPDDSNKWSVPPEEIIWQYLDSKIPVIIGLDGRGDTIGHVVVAVGAENGPHPPGLPQATTLGGGARALIVNDDQWGPYSRLPVRREEGVEGPCGYTLEDCTFILIPMPEKVFSSGGDADLLARDVLRRLLQKRDAVLADEWQDGVVSSPLDPILLKASAGDSIVSRTFLTHGWNYQARAIKSRAHPEVRRDIGNSHFPRFVWVTEFYLPDSCMSWPPADGTVVAQIVLDATGNVPLVADIPGLAAVYHFDAISPGDQGIVSWFRTLRTDGLDPKRGGAVGSANPIKNAPLGTDK